MKTAFTKIASLTLVSLISLQAFYTVVFEPSLAEAVTDNVIVTLTVDAGITISDGAAVTMSPNIGISANGSIGSSSWVVTTNDADGYTLAVQASASPALASGGNSFADYTEAVAGTPEVWSVPGGSKEFGYSAFGTDTSTAEYGTGASCGSAGAPTGTAKYEGFDTSPNTIATRASVTPTTGITTTICFAAEQDTTFAAAGTYTATITGTALAL